MIDWTPTLVQARGSFAQRAGIYYERQVTRFFDQKYLCAVQPTIWVRGRRRRPDLLVFDEGCYQCVVIEVKYSFVWSAFEQLKKYEALLRCELPWVRVGTLVVCKNFEPQEGVTLVDETQLFAQTGPGVMVLSERELRVGRHGSGVGRRAPSFAVRQSGSVGDFVCNRVGLPRVATKTGAG